MSQVLDAFCRSLLNIERRRPWVDCPVLKLWRVRVRRQMRAVPNSNISSDGYRAAPALIEQSDLYSLWSLQGLQDVGCAFDLWLLR